MERIRKLPQYVNWRSDILSRDNYTCQYCKIRGCELEVHHINPFYKIVEDNNIKSIEDAYKCNELWDIKNGITLCKDCHNLTK